MRTLIVATCVGLVFTLAAGPAQASDNETIQGTWKFVSGNRGGEPPPDRFAESFRLTFKADGKVEAVLGQERRREGTFKLDPTKKPKSIVITFGNDTVSGVYELSKDQLKFCIAPENEERPTGFKTKPGSRQTLMVFKRLKE